MINFPASCTLQHTVHCFSVLLPVWPFTNLSAAVAVLCCCRWIDRVFLPAINQAGTDGWDIVRVANAIKDMAQASGDEVGSATCWTHRNTPPAWMLLCRKRLAGYWRHAQLRQLSATSPPLLHLPATTHVSTPSPLLATACCCCFLLQTSAAAAEAVLGQWCASGYPWFRLHPKGRGVVVARQAGVPAFTFVEEYFGELHTGEAWQQA
jgi:hypothetical protein